MRYSDLVFFKKWFSEYTKSFCSSNEKDKKNISLKIIHTYNVCENIVRISKGQKLTQNEIRLSETAALFHDIGRFPQYARYKTFNDTISKNHGRLGAEVLKKEDILRSLPQDEQELIIHTVRFHNAFAIPNLRDSRKILFLRLIRDADKLDIWRVFDEYYDESEDEKANSVAAHGLPDIPEYSEKVLSCIYKGKMASMRHVKTLNDFKLMHLTWIYDLNFDTSYKLLLERGYIKKIASRLPRTEEIERAVKYLDEYVKEKVYK
jgi:HD superfamily phosphohydrolase YqeK